MKYILLITTLVSSAFINAQQLKTIDLLETDSWVKHYEELDMYATSYLVQNKDYDDKKEITLKIYKYKSGGIYNIHWGFNDFWFLFSSIDRDNPYRKVQIENNESIFTSHQNKRMFVMKEVSENTYEPISVLLKNRGVQYLYRIEKKEISNTDLVSETDKNETIEGEIEKYINPLQQQLMNSFSICDKKEIKQVAIVTFDSELGEYETTSEQTTFCNSTQKVILNFLPNEGVEGFYYFIFSNMSLKEVTNLVFKSYSISFKTESMGKQKYTNPKDAKSYSMMEQTTISNQKIIEIRGFYDGESGDYIKVEEKKGGIIQVHISYNGI